MNLINHFIRQSEIQPDRIALVQEQKTISYLELASKVTSVANFLMAQSEQNQRVAIFLDRSIDAAIALLACLHNGFCYVPLDINNPAQRLNYIINDADVLLVMGQGKRPDWLDSRHQWCNLNQVVKSDEPIKPAKQLDLESLAAILYTSGSTGNPKGVALSHRAINNFTEWAANTFNINASDKIASLSPFYFDLSTFDLLTSLSQGATVFFVPQKLALSPSKLCRWLAEHQITTWYTVPSLLSFIALKGDLKNTALPFLKSILFAGEVFPTPMLSKLVAQLPDVSFYNLYGPTETNVCCYWPVNKKRLNSNHAIPIGLPAAHAELKINPDNEALQVKCKNNFSGYWVNGQLISYQDCNDFYNTGDKVSVNEKGEYCYHGRLDRMMKCSGFRVEPAEIERVINAHPGVVQCAVAAIKDPTSGQRPAAVVILKKDVKLAEIHHFIRQHLPTYMQPNKLVQLDKMPCLANGKTDILSIEKRLSNKSL